MRAGDRFPSIGFHWLLGALESARGRHAYAIAEFNQELAQIDRRRLYGPEYGAVALVARGQAELATGQAAQALASFQAARLYVEDYPRAWVGEVLALAETDDAAAADQARRHARHAQERFERTGRHHDAWYAAACAAAVDGNYGQTLSRLDHLLASARRQPRRLDRADRAVLPAAARTAGLRDHARAAGGPGEVAGIQA